MQLNPTLPSSISRYGLQIADKVTISGLEARMSEHASVKLDPLNAPFEGPEKLLEIWFEPPTEAEQTTERQGLLAVSREKWEEMLDIVRCKVLSIIQGHELDAYLLRCVQRPACRSEN